METVDVTTNGGGGRGFVVLPPGVTYEPAPILVGKNIARLMKKAATDGHLAIRFCSQCGCDMDKHMLHSYEDVHNRVCAMCRHKARQEEIDKMFKDANSEGEGVKLALFLLTVAALGYGLGKLIEVCN